MPYVTSAVNEAAKALSFPFELRDDALAKAAELADRGIENVSVTDIETGEVLTGPDLLVAIEALAAGE
jgi:hypothetical protein